MTKRFRMVAGPNGSGKSTLTAWLMRDYAVNFYTMLNSGAEMRYVASYSDDGGFAIHLPKGELPKWFERLPTNNICKGEEL